MRLNTRGQSTLEYAVLISIVVGALVAMQIYMKRGLEGKIHESTNQIGEQFEAGKTIVYSKTSSTSTSVQETKNGETVTDSGGLALGGVAEVRKEHGHENVDRW